MVFSMRLGDWLQVESPTDVLLYLFLLGISGHLFHGGHLVITPFPFFTSR